MRNVANVCKLYNSLTMWIVEIIILNMKRYLFLSILFIFLSNIVVSSISHICYDCKNSPLKSNCCKQETKPDLIKSQCTCCSKERGDRELYYIPALKEENKPLLFVVSSLLDLHLIWDLNLESATPERYGGISHLPIYKETLRLRI